MNSTVRGVETVFYMVNPSQYREGIIGNSHKRKRCGPLIEKPLSFVLVRGARVYPLCPVSILKKSNLVLVRTHTPFKKTAAAKH